MSAWVTPHELRLDVRGEQFCIRPLTDSPGQYQYEWLSARTPGYGFSGGFTGPVEMTVSDHVQAIEEFLDEIAPDAGYEPK